jgi:hypothetical protein
MYAKDFGCLTEVLSIPRQGPLNIDPLELTERFLQQNLAVQHFIDERLEA